MSLTITNNNGVTVQESDSSGTIALTTTIPNVAGDTVDTYAYNGNHLLSSFTHLLNNGTENDTGSQSDLNN